MSARAKEKLEYAKFEIESLGYDVTYESKSEIRFEHKGSIVIFYPKKEWATGRSIKDCRGLKNLLNQI